MTNRGPRTASTLTPPSMSHPREKPLYYPVLMCPGHSGQGRDRAGPYRWRRPTDTPQQAQAVLRTAIAEGSATLGFVVRMDDRGPEILVKRTEPAAARAIVEHYEAVWTAIDNEHPWEDTDDA